MSFKKNLLKIILFILTVSVVVYVYFDIKNKKIIMKKKRLKKNSSNKKVRFNSEIDWNTITEQSDYSISNKQNIIYSDDSSTSGIGPDGEIDTSSDNDNWDSSFGVPLLDPKNKKNYLKKINRGHKKYTSSLSDFTSYLTDNSTVIRTDTTIDPFGNDKRNTLKGKKVKDIYDETVVDFKARPMKIKKRTKNRIYYQNEKDMNGGKIAGTNIYGVKESDCMNYQNADFGNEF